MINPPSILSWLDGRDLLGNLRIAPLPIDRFGEIQLFWLLIRKSIPTHTIHEITHPSMHQMPSEHINYLNTAKALLSQFSGESLNSIQWRFLNYAERNYIITKLGTPPHPSAPIYIITIERDGLNKIVYIGKTTNIDSRFANGHLALSKLLNPKYDGFKKNIFFCELYFGIYENFNTVSIDFAPDCHEKNIAIETIEKMIINAFSPELNMLINNPNRPPPRGNIELSIENKSGEYITIPIHEITDSILRNGRSLIGAGF